MKMSTDVQRYTLNGETMGTRYTAVFYATAGIDTDEIGQRLAHAVSRVDRQMSTWKADSDLNRLRSPRKHSRCHCHARDSPPARRWWWTRNAIGCANGRR